MAKHNTLLAALQDAALLQQDNAQAALDGLLQAFNQEGEDISADTIKQAIESHTSFWQAFIDVDSDNLPGDDLKKIKTSALQSRALHAFLQLPNDKKKELMSKLDTNEDLYQAYNLLPKGQTHQLDNKFFKEILALRNEYSTNKKDDQIIQEYENLEQKSYSPLLKSRLKNFLKEDYLDAQIRRLPKGDKRQLAQEGQLENDAIQITEDNTEQDWQRRALLAYVADGDFDTPAPTKLWQQLETMKAGHPRAMQQKLKELGLELPDGLIDEALCERLIALAGMLLRTNAVSRQHAALALNLDAAEILGPDNDIAREMFNSRFGQQAFQTQALRQIIAHRLVSMSESELDDLAEHNLPFHTFFPDYPDDHAQYLPKAADALYATLLQTEKTARAQHGNKNFQTIVGLINQEDEDEALDKPVLYRLALQAVTQLPEEQRQRFLTAKSPETAQTILGIDNSKVALDSKTLAHFKHFARIRFLQKRIEQDTLWGDARPALQQVLQSYLPKEVTDTQLQALVQARTLPEIKQILQEPQLETQALPSLVDENQRLMRLSRIQNYALAQALSQLPSANLSNDQIKHINHQLQAANDIDEEVLKSFLSEADVDKVAARLESIQEQHGHTADLRNSQEPSHRLLLAAAKFKAKPSNPQLDAFNKALKNSTHYQDFVKALGQPDYLEKNWTRVITPDVFQMMKQQAIAHTYSNHSPDDIAQRQAQFKPYQQLFKFIKHFHQKFAKDLAQIQTMEEDGVLDGAYHQLSRDKAQKIEPMLQSTAQNCAAILTQLYQQQQLVENELRALQTLNTTGQNGGSVELDDLSRQQNTMFKTLNHTIDSKFHKWQKQLVAHHKKLDAEIDYFKGIQQNFYGDDDTAGLLAYVEQAKTAETVTLANSHFVTHTDYPRGKQAESQTSSPEQPLSEDEKTCLLDQQGKVPRFQKRKLAPQVAHDHVREYTVASKNQRGSAGRFTDERDTSRYASSQARKVTLTQFPEQPLDRIEVALRMAMHKLLARSRPPTKEHPIVLTGSNAQELQYVWTALMVLSKNQHFKFDASAIKVNSLAFDPAQETTWFGKRFSDDSLYAQASQHFKSARAFREYKAIQQEKFAKPVSVTNALKRLAKIDEAPMINNRLFKTNYQNMRDVEEHNHKNTAPRAGG
ncbi:MAG: hypothetical protein CMF38_05085 [Legionellaceae bacterium]|nr:hypothetical protein [Legionellaceae bacterium]HAF87988.1 hypothetical protein [Legionellales bacterium]HCA89450.1 hypothetical protein [Legionellales bacterium]|tara:strand:- start:1917 stop:5363 length:3447 start_codon:yes stop_codon:yes gene_type:complete